MGYGQPCRARPTLVATSWSVHIYVNRTVLSGLCALALAIAVTVGLSPAPTVAASCAAENPGWATQICGGAISPGSGTSSTSFTFSVTYKQTGNTPYQYVRVVISGAGGTHDMAPTGNTWSAGVTFRYTTTLPAGSYTYYYVGTRTGNNPPTRYDPEQPATYSLTVTRRRRRLRSRRPSPPRSRRPSRRLARPRGRRRDRRRGRRRSRRRTRRRRPSWSRPHPTGSPSPSVEPSASDDADGDPAAGRHRRRTGAGDTPDPNGAGSLGPSGGSGGSSPTIILALVLVAFTVGGAFAILAARRRRPQDEDQTLATAAAAAATTAVATAQGCRSSRAHGRIHRRGLDPPLAPSVAARRSLGERSRSGRSDLPARVQRRRHRGLRAPARPLPRRPDDGRPRRDPEPGGRPARGERPGRGPRALRRISPRAHPGRHRGLGPSDHARTADRQRGGRRPESERRSSIWRPRSTCSEPARCPRPFAVATPSPAAAVAVPTPSPVAAPPAPAPARTKAPEEPRARRRRRRSPKAEPST